MSTLSQGTESTAAVDTADTGNAVERAVYTRAEPVESTIKPAAFVTLTVLIIVLVVVSFFAIYAGGNFDGGEPGLTAPMNG
ncbi:hypothetical protein [Streptodolium elevatio]|uniref:Uncharacterized protein n=1 Tax=Streptodolium elevatio TaxID=3157996 RepID=A0ABV3DUW8_9ACTN